MNETLRAILEIDRSTRELQDNTEHVLEQERQNTRDEMLRLQKESTDAMHAETDRQIAEIEKQREKEESALLSSSNKKIEIIWRFFDAHREKMAGEWFERLKDSHEIG